MRFFALHFNLKNAYAQLRPKEREEQGGGATSGQESCGLTDELSASTGNYSSCHLTWFVAFHERCRRCRRLCWQSQCKFALTFDDSQ